MGTLDSKIALITGAASGMGRAMALGYAHEGAHVVIADLNLDGANTVVDEIRAAGGSASAKSLNVSSTEESKRVVDEIVAEHGSLDILVNNAGVGLIKPLDEMTPDEWDRIFNVNVKGLMFLTQAACVPMREQNSGKIINMASIAGRRGEALVSAYCASKAAVISITQSVALAMAPYGVNVNAMAPGIVDTPYWKQVDKQFGDLTGKAEGETFKEKSADVPLGRTSVPEDIVPLAVFLAGPGSNYITAQTYNVEGGMVMS
ncbi:MULTISPECIES: glucose 1-dehydrogenase [unclassified Pseudoclavibacter]|uniref:glucose 1-dehydrogenase n=1 Tax=unclassified Pseudoclavibacter TaxID=2615177 RepID=UPI001BAC3148|nr:glucose 1-dehydrogenase [Pseudoclavibacter sp. Marseille-Q4354]MBS3179139.1 glucose 1-dehydrogenase [Pseudoclavibacter sp. Marseille-Q4354]